MLYTYCFLSSPHYQFTLPQGLTGELTLIEESAITAVVETNLPREDLEENDQTLIEAVLNHDRVICEIFQNTPVLPLRFGTYFRGQDDLLSHLKENAQNYQNQLYAIAGKAEVTLKLTPIPFSETSDLQATGKAYLKAKKQQYQAKTNYQNQQEAALETFKEQINQMYPNLIHDQPKETTERFYLLLNYTNFSALVQQIELWEESLENWQIEISEPLPPYHFL